MRFEPWQLLLGLAGILAIIGIISAAGVAEPGDILGIVVFAVVFGILTYAGYRLGQALTEWRAN